MEFEILYSQSESDEEISYIGIQNSTPKLPLILTEDFYLIVEKRDNGVQAVCMQCNTKISGSLRVTSNFLTHMKLKHHIKYEEYLLKKKQHKHFYNRHQIKQNKFEVKLLKYMVSSCVPSTTVENKDFISLFEGTNLNVRSRKYMQNLMDKKYMSMVENIKQEIKKINYVCATADIWSGNNKSFFGYTIHWIEKNFERRSAALACTRFQSPHNYEHIASIIMSINNTFGLDNDKLLCTITDNASNFVKAFKEFGVQSNCSEEDCSSDEDNFDVNSYTSFSPYLSKHLRCSSHTLNLLATTDFIAQLRTNTYVLQKHKLVLKRCSNIWNKCKRPRTHEIIKNVISASLKTPVCTRWNSLYDAIYNLLQNKEKLTELTLALGVESLSPGDISYLEEYVKLMAPISEALDFLQSEKNIFYGHLIPTLLTLKYKIRKIGVSLNDLKDIAKGLEEDLEKRFYFIFYLNDIAFDAVIAAVTCPKIKILKCKKLLEIWQETSPQCTARYIEDLCIAQMVKFVDNEVKATKVQTISSHKFFKLDDSDDEETIYEFNSRENLRHEICSFTNDEDDRLQQLLKYPLINNVFFKFNTPLPSSAPVERLFSFAGIVNGQRRHRLTDDHFEQLVLAKANGFYFE